MARTCQLTFNLNARVRIQSEYTIVLLSATIVLRTLSKVLCRTSGSPEPSRKVAHAEVIANYGLFTIIKQCARVLSFGANPHRSPSGDLGSRDMLIGT